MINKLYYWLWHDILKLKKPITHITQDEQKANPVLFLLIFLGLGILVVKVAKDYWWQILIGFLIGVITGHIFW